MGTNTGIGIGIGIPFRNNALGGDNMYFPPELKARMIGVWDNYGKKNTDADRNIIKNKIPNAGGDLEILNSAYKLNSGFGKYEVDFTSWIQTDGVIASSDKVQNSIVGRFLYFNTVNKKEDVPSFKVNITLGQQSKLQYNYIKEDGTSTYIVYSESGIYTIPASYFSKYTGGNAWFGFYQIEGTSIIEQIPSFEGALVTDGINDIIASIKTLEEWNIGDKGITIVSMIHQINTNSNNFITTNNIRTDNKVVGRNIVSNIEKTGIYGWYKENIQSDTINVINNILGDKNDYTLHSSPSTNINPINNSKFYVQGYAVENGFIEISSIAHYWTFAVLDKATEDEINLIIAKYNLDRTLRPDILCNITKQGITNDNHADFNDKLIDYSGNGRDIQMNNLAWKGGSGIAAKQYETFKDWTNTPYQTSTVTEIDEFTRVVDSTSNAYWVSMINRTSDFDKVHDSINIVLYQDDMLLVHECKYKIDENVTTKALYETLKSGVNTITLATIDKFTDIPEDAKIMSLGEWVNPKSNKGSVKITLLPSYKGGLLLDGVDDFGKVTGMPVYKDYTIIADYERISGIEQAWAEALISKSYIANQGAFVLMETNGTAKHSYSFGAYTTFNKDDSTRTLLYQSKYKCGDVNLNAGTGVDGDTLWLGTYRDNYSSFFNGVIYSLMSFPYSMSEFLIERQLKKHKLGTLYPDMVEFRPVIKKDDRIKSIKYYIDGKIANIGQYYPIGSGLGIAVETVQPYMVKSLKVNGVNTIPNADYKGFNARLDSKSPQKITMDIQVDTNLIQWNPIITSTAELTTAPTFAIRGTSTLLKAGDWIPKNSEIWVIVTMNNLIDELRKFSFNGTFIHIPSSSYNPDTGKYGFPFVIDNESPQNINLTIDEYIRYEDIVQPYPILLGLRDENDNEVSWGDKLRVGSTATFTRGLKDSDLLYGMYKIDSIWLNNENMIVVADGRPLGIEKKMEFRSAKEWLLDNNEPKCILSPRLLRIPNSSYKILGYIPDISGHGNHGKINNSAYAGASGANGYLQNFSGWTKASGVSSTDSVISSSNNLVAANGWIAYVKSGTVVPTFKVEISGIPINGNLRFEGSGQTLVNGVNTIQGLTTTKISGFYISSGYDNDWSNLRIEQVGEYEGAYCLDGVDDFVTIPTLSSGGKQVLMKVNWSSLGMPIYEQRTPGKKNFAIISNSSAVAYIEGNDGNTYIDGILNNNIKGNELVNITHNITITNELSEKPNTSPMISMNNGRNAFTKMSLYDFMLFDGISTDDKILELNEYVGIEAKVKLPPYYWDAYGKTNLDGDKATIQQRGVAVGDFDLTNNNLAYEGMSGYNGYPVVFGENKTWVNLGEYYVWTVSATKFNITQLCFTKALQFSYIKANGSIITANNKDIAPFRIKVTGIEPDKFSLRYIYLSTANATLESTITINSDGIYELPKSFASDGSLTSSDRWVGFSFIKRNTELANVIDGVNVTIEVLPEYENGLVYDGITNYSKNANIPALDDFTAIIKREWLKKQGCPLIKGSKVYEGGNGNALLLEWDKAYNFVFYKRTDIMEGELPDNISFITPTNYNGNVITRGSEQDTNGICIAGDGNAGFANMVFYKLILYPKTIPLLQINFLKNLMERDEIIDLTNPIFIKNE